MQARVITINGQPISFLKLGQIAEVKQGMATGDNHVYLFQNAEARGTYRSIAEYADFLLTEAELIQIASDEKLRSSIVEEGIVTKDKKSKRYFGGRYILPYDKGGESNSDGGWLPNYYVPTEYFIDWSEAAVERLKSYTSCQRAQDKGEKGGDDKLISRFQNTHLYFVLGITWSDAGQYSPTFRISGRGVFDVKGSRMVINGEFSPLMVSGILGSKLSKLLIKQFNNHTISTQVDDLKEIPFPIKVADKIETLVAAIIKKQKANPRYDYASNEQLEIDQLMYEAYGLNAADIAEVEAWYARRYPRLAAAQAANRASATA